MFDNKSHIRFTTAQGGQLTVPISGITLRHAPAVPSIDPTKIQPTPEKWFVGPAMVLKDTYDAVSSKLCLADVTIPVVAPVVKPVATPPTPAPNK